MIYKEISLLLNKIGIDLNKIKINKNDINNVNKSETYKSIAVNKENEEDFVNFSDISLDKDEGETNYNDENFIYNNEETLENVYFKLKTIYGDRKYNIKQEAILENNMKKVYKYIPISKIDVMVTNHSRNDKIKDKLRDAMPIVKYIYSKEFKDFDKVRLEYLLKDYDNQKYEEIDHLQKQLLEKEPFKIIYEEDIFYEIYYMKEENRYILLICTEDIVFKEIQYMLQKKAEYYISRKEEYIYAGIVNLEYSENFLYKEEIEELEDIVWYFTKSWPTTLLGSAPNAWPITYELYNNKNEYSIEIVGDFEIYNGLISPYRISLKNKNKAVEYLKLAKALMTLEKDTNKYLKFQTIISEKDGLEFKYNDNDIILKDIPDFLLVNYVKLYEETMVYIDENMAKELKFKRLTEEKLKKEEKLNDLQNYITTFLDSKKTFFGKFRYFLGKDPLKQLEQKEKELENKKKKGDISEKNNISLDEDEEKKLREIERKEIQELKEKLNLKRDFCTIEEYIYLYKEYEKQNKKLKSYLKDIRSSRTYNRKLR